MLSLALVALTLAGPADALKLPASTLVAMRCTSAQDLIDTWGGVDVLSQIGDNADSAPGIDELIDAGLALDAPILATLTLEDGATIARMRLPAKDSGALLAVLQGSPIADDDLELVAEAGHVTLTARRTEELGSMPMGDGSDMGALLDLVDFDAPGCFLAVDLGASSEGVAAMAGELGGLFVQGYADDPDRIRVGVSGLEVPGGYGALLEGEDPWRAAQGRSAWSPFLVARLNLDLNAVIEALAEAPLTGRMALMAAPLAAVNDSSLSFAPGLELAVGTNEAAGPEVALVVPLRRPVLARRLPKKLARRMEKDGAAVAWEGDLLRMPVMGTESFYIGATRRTLIVGSSASSVNQIVGEVGEPWPSVSSELAELPGVYMHVDGTHPMVRDRAQNDMAARVSTVDIVVQKEGEALIMWMDAEGYRELMVDAISERVGASRAGEPEEPAAAPPSSEAAALLMLISTRQDAAFAQSGLYVSYSGGPRDIDQLDGQAVAWGGIPSLDIGPMDTPCRFEISLSEGGYTARAVCDEDGDGAQAIYLVNPGAIPSRVTPQGVK